METSGADPPPETIKKRYAGDAALFGVLCVYIAAYVALAINGVYVFIYKIALVPAFAIYGVLAGDVRGFVRDWFPALGAVALFDASRGAAHALVQARLIPVLVNYPIVAESWLTGHDSASTVLQTALRSRALDRAMVLVHGAHFLVFALLGLLLWHSRRDAFLTYKRALICVLYAGLVGYLMVPTVPPWLAAERGALAGLVRIVSHTYTTEMPQLFAAFDTNPVAAMPSLHAALPMVAALIVWQTFGRVAGVFAGLYVLTVAFALVYLGEHYIIDIVAGVLLAILVFRFVSRRPRPVSSMTPAGAALLGLSLFIAAFAVFAVARHP